MVAEGTEPADLKKAIAFLQGWAGQHYFVRRLLLFGSRIRGTQRPDSDFDVAVEFDPVGLDSDCLTTWICEAKKWRKQLQPHLPWTLHLEWHDPGGGTPTISAGLKESSLLIYERGDLVNMQIESPIPGPQLGNAAREEGGEDG